MKALVTAAEVRTWAQGNDSTKSDPTVQSGARGRLSPAVRNAYNAAHKGAPYVEANHARKSVVVPVKRTQGGKVRTIKTPIQASTVRSLAREFGLTNPAVEGRPERGRFPADALEGVGAALLDVDLKTVNSL